MTLKKMLCLALSSVVVACSHTPTASNLTLTASTHPYANSRLNDSETAGPICPYRSFLFCTDYAHQSILHRYPDIFHANDQALTVRLYNGTTKSYLNQSIQDNCLDCEYRVIADYPQIHSIFLFQPTLGEKNLRLLNLKNGTETRLENIPVFSPDFKYMLEFNDIANSSAKLKIYQFSSDHVASKIFASALVVQPITDGTMNFQAVKWLDSQRFIVKIQQFNTDHESQDLYFLIKHHPTQNPTWQITSIQEDEYQQLKEL